MKLYAVVVNRDDTVRVASVDVIKETPQFYVTNANKLCYGLGWGDPRREELYAFGYGDRTPKDRAFTSARAALTAYMERRQRDKANAQSVIGQAGRQIASANELLMRLLATESPQTVDAVDPVGEKVTG